MVDKALKESKAGYRGENNSKAFNDAKQFFVARYNDDWLRVLDILEPYIPETSAGKVMIDYKKVSRAPVDTWTDMLFTGPQMWDVQEDLWFLKAPGAGHRQSQPGRNRHRRSADQKIGGNDAPRRRSS